MKKKDYLNAIRIPAILLVIQVVIAYFSSVFLYRGIATYEQVAASLGTLSLFSFLLMAITFGIIFYAGWTTVSVYKGNINDSVMTGLIVGCIQIILSFINIILMYFTIPGYRIGMSPITSYEAIIGPAALFLALMGFIIGSFFSLLIYAGIAALAGFAAIKSKKK